ncbi:tetratricopeptide repeat protein [Nitratidesulfovibrio vulgaris]|uniref:Uncharacterized protein n=1 Tax=Nitratidesulfovibrio vulgaris (strain DP4) TaxID=391774 RepID=A0A0H3AAM5_NITV4|nr:hypothetical protein [Nitratidesulfovibrio vulgaris]ABM29687.1 conserved hypothetical protein [Nitratidesulfovibrio vulgaris DP4]GEB80151.1 hypothetical protein DDE01_15660 [Desulfovibrio desulfuricans]
MTVDAKKVREHFARARAYYQRRDAVRALAAACLGVQGMASAQLSGVGLVEAQGALREVLQLFSRDAAMRAAAADLAPHGFAYQRGGEKALLAVLRIVHDELDAAGSRESYEDALARKQRIDAALLQGMRLLQQNKVSEADASFAVAVQNYRDEHRLFLCVGRLLVDAGEVRRAIPYLKRGMEVDPADETMAGLLAEAMRRRDGAA